MIKREIIPVIIDGIEFKIMEFIWRDSVKLEKEVLTILAPLLDIMGELKNNKNVKSIMDYEINNLGGILQKALLSLDDPFAFFKKMFASTYYPKQNPNGILELLLDNDEIINEAFHGKTMTAIKLCVEIMKVNKFSFIQGLGGLGKITDMFVNMNQKEKRLEKK